MAGLLALPTFASLPIRIMNSGVKTGKDFIPTDVGNGITAAGPLLNITGFPIKPFGA